MVAEGEEKVDRVGGEIPENKQGRSYLPGRNRKRRRRRV